ncbi:MAG: nuclear transport factor 2 family protein, partial [Bacteroidota bacterium]
NFQFKDGKIIDHKDEFSFWRWSSMALGPVGTFLGFTPFLQNKVKKMTRKLLTDYMQKHGI